MQVLVQAERGSVLEKMGRDGFIVDQVLHEITVLIYSERCKTIQDSRVDLLPPVRDDTNDDFLPRILAPRLRVLSRAEMPYVTHDAVESSAE